MAKVFINEWVFEPFYDDPGAEHRRMFGCKALYYYGKLILVLSESEKDKRWQKLFFPCERQNHREVMSIYPVLKSHEVLAKWLCISLDNEEFESIATEVINRLLNKDPLFGVIPERKPRSKKKKKSDKKLSEKTRSKKSSKNSKPKKKTKKIIARKGKSKGIKK